MTWKRETPKAQDAVDLSISAVLGLADKGATDWARMRGLQYSGLAQISFYRVYLNAVLSLLVAMIFNPKVGPIWVGLWLLLQGLVQYHGRKIDLELADTDRRMMTSDEFRRQKFSAAVSSLGWLCALLFL